MSKLLLVLSQPFSQTKGGVSRSNYKMGKFFASNGLDVHYYSFSYSGHEVASYGRLHSSPQKGRDTNEDNIRHFKEVISEVKPDLVINHVVYNDPITHAITEAKKEYGLNFRIVGILRNSLHNFVLDVRHRLKFMFSPAVFPLIDNKLGIQIMKYRHVRNQRKQLEFILSHFDKLVLLTPPNIDELKYFIKDFDRSKVTSVSNILPEIEVKPESKERIILHVGRLEEVQKRSSLLIDFWENLHDKLPGWKFVIVGSGPSEGPMKERAAELGLKNIEFVGHADPYPYYRKASIFVMPSGFEGFPNVLLEAQGYGTVPVAFDSYPAVSWIVNHEQDGLLCKAFNTEEMAESVFRLIRSPDKLKMMRENAVINSGRFSIEKIGARWLELFDELGIPAPVKNKVTS